MKSNLLEFCSFVIVLKINAIDNRGLDQPYACHVAIIAPNLIKVNLKLYSKYSTEFSYTDSNF